EEKTLYYILRAADSRQEAPGSFYISAALDNRFGQITDYSPEPKQQPEDGGMCPGERGQMARHQFEQHQTAKQRKTKRAEKTFPCFFCTDMRRHQMTAD